MIKVKNALSIVFISVIMAAIYGALHDLVTYHLSPDYYIHFKFPQFHAQEMAALAGNKVAAMLVGVSATWWFGLIIGMVLSLIWHRKNSIALSNGHYLTSISIVFLCSIFSATLGYFLPVAIKTISIPIPLGVKDSHAFTKVGMLHNFSYLGGLIGIICACIFLIRKKKSVAIA